MGSAYSQEVYDVDLNYGQGLSFSVSGDLQLCSGVERSKQRILRRLMTSPVTGYLWHVDYGAGLPRFIGENFSRTDEIQSLILSQIYLESSVSQTPEPKISFQTIQGGIFVQIDYVESSSKQAVVLTFNIPN